MADLELFPGCIHMGTTVDGDLAHVWPTPDPERWHVSFSRGPLATFEPVLTAEVAGVLDEWGVRVDSWTAWAGRIGEAVGAVAISPRRSS